MALSRSQVSTAPGNVLAFGDARQAGARLLRLGDEQVDQRLAVLLPARRNDAGGMGGKASLDAGAARRVSLPGAQGATQVGENFGAGVAHRRLILFFHCC